MLLVLRRRSLEEAGDVQLFGDAGVLSTWLERTGF
jgi:hypothetical protein